MADRVHFAPYQPAARAGVLAVLASNTPTFFAASEADDLAASLDDPDGPFWTISCDDVIIGLGGYEIGEVYSRCVLTWGMIARAWHGRGLGRRLLAQRVRAAMAETAGDTRWLVVDTTLAVAGFYERCGFERVETWQVGYRAGFDMVVLRMGFGSAAMAALVAAEAAPQATDRAGGSERR